MAELEIRLRETLHNAARGDGTILVLTGAGISAESGIPTFRGKEGYWSVGAKEYHPQELATHAAFERLPREVWRWYLYRRAVCRAAPANDGHLALVRLEQAFGDRFRLVTQNVDGLHLRAGNTAERTYQIHGNIDFMRCADACTTQTFPLPGGLEERDKTTPLSDDDFARLVCPQCSGLARPHVLWFDECYDEPLFRATSSLNAAADAAILLVVGTSGATNLPMQIGVLTARRGQPIIDLNIGHSPFAEFADAVDGFKIRGPSGQTLPPLVQALCSA